MLRAGCDVPRQEVPKVARTCVLQLNGRDLRKAGQVLWVCDGGDEFDRTYDGAGRPAVSVGTGHTGTSGTCRVGIMM